MTRGLRSLGANTLGPYERAVAVADLDQPIQPERQMARRAFYVNLTALPNFRLARHPAAIRTGTSTTWLHRWATYSRMSSGPSWSAERWKYRSNYTSMSSEHGCERLSHDQPIVFSRP